MIHVPLTPEQAEAVAREWIVTKCKHDYKTVLTLVFQEARTPSWSWLDAIAYCVSYCAEQYHVRTAFIVGDLTRTFKLTGKTK